MDKKKKKSETYFEKFLNYFKRKISYKMLRMEIIEELKLKKSSFSLKMNFIEENFSFFLVNAAVLNIYLNRKKQGVLLLFGSTVFVCSYTYLVFVFYGEEKIFYRNCLRNDELGYYLRER